MDALRRFHFGEPEAAAHTQLPEGAILPALLNAYRDASAIRYEYPLYVTPVSSAADATLAIPLTDHLQQSVSAFAPGDDDARILKDNLPWLERHLRQQLDGPDPVDAPALFRRAAAALLDHLALGGNNRDKLEADLASLEKAMLPGSTFLAYGPDSPLHLLVHAVRCRDLGRRERLKRDMGEKLRGLEALLEVEAAKSGQRDPPAASGNGAASQHLDTRLLSDMLEKRSHGSIAMDPGRRARIESAVEVLRSWNDDPVLVRFTGSLKNPWFASQTFIDVVDSRDPCMTASDMFEKDAGKFAGLFAALRIAALEIDGNYNSAIHDSWFRDFDWRAFSEEELQSVTRNVALAPADHLASDGLPSFSRLLGSRRPVHILSWVRAYDNPAVRPGEGPFDAYRFELAYFGVGHRQVVVAQTSAARHGDLLEGCLCALDSNRTSLHLVNRGTQTHSDQPILDPWFVASAALESRAHPFLLVNPGDGDRAAERVRFDGNPQSEADWPVETLAYESTDGERREMPVAFTFADYALLMPALREHFRVVPVNCESDDLVPVADYLQTNEKHVERLVPFVWGINEKGSLLRLVVSRALVFACRDRLNYWRTLQELAGIHNFYVEAAVERVLEDAQAATEAEREKLIREHKKEIEAVRTEATGDAMGQLVDVLMGADLSQVVGQSVLATMPTEPAAATSGEAALDEEPEASAAQAEPEEEETVSFDEPWLDTASCTTCDDCMSINKMMFAYNEDKQAYLKDPRAGTYADLVTAAETCPAKCIHPGKPLDPGEPGLEELIARAAPFN